MTQIRNTQYFLLIPDIKLFPEIKPSTIPMLEQVMNALILTNKANLQHGISSVITLESYCKDLLKDSYLAALDKIKPILKGSNIHVAQGEEVREMYPIYHKNKYYWDIGKQTAVNTEFALEKKISYNGKKITWENTYIDWVNQIIAEDREAVTHNSADEFLFYTLAPKTLESYVETRDIILNETEKYADEYRKQIQLQQAKAQ